MTDPHAVRYGRRHRRIRAALAPTVNAGAATCWRCETTIVPDPTIPGHGWDLGHDDITGDYRGPEHATCNRAAGSAKRDANRQAPDLVDDKPLGRPSRAW